MVIEKLNFKKDNDMQWHIQAVNITTNLKVKIDFTLPELSATKIVAWNCHVHDSVKSVYEIVLGRHILILLGLNLKLSQRVIKADDWYLRWSTVPMVHICIPVNLNIKIHRRLHMRNYLWMLP